MAIRISNITNVAHVMLDLKKRGHSTTLFIGAGVSVSANIPPSNEIINRIRIEHGPLVENMVNATYPAYMAALSHGQRKRMINEYIAGSKINLAHIYIANLVDKGLVDVIVTTNFDPMTLKALSLFNIFPAVYDLAMTKDYTPGGFSFPAIVFLHGQAHGFWQLNTEGELQLPRQTIKKAIQEVTTNRAMIVCGYSGSDPVFEDLKEFPKFEEGLFWVGYKDAEPENHLKSNFLDNATKGASYITGFDADSFFYALNSQLELETPEIFIRPFTHVLRIFESLGELRLPGSQSILIKQAEELLLLAKKGFEKGDIFGSMREMVNHPQRIQDVVTSMGQMMEKQAYPELTDTVGEAIEKLTLNEFRATMLLAKSISVFKNAQVQSNDLELRSRLFADALRDVSLSTELFPEKCDTWSNWGSMLVEIAETQVGIERLNTLVFATSRLQKAISIRNDRYITYHILGLAYLRISMMITDKEEKKGLLAESIQQFKKVTELNPEYAYAWDGWANGIVQYSRFHGEKEREELLLWACKLCVKAVEINSELYFAWHTWGDALIELSKIYIKERGLDLLQEALEKTKKAITFDPKATVSWYNLSCIYALMGQTENCLQTLKNAYKLDAIYVNSLIETDDDFTTMREQPEFIEIIMNNKS
jgi:tetratricopeptide (TPR) repeat protein